MKYFFAILCALILTLNVNAQNDSTKSKQVDAKKIMTGAGKLVKKGIITVKELFMNHKIPKDYIKMVPISQTTKDSIQYIGIIDKKKPELELRLLYPRINPKKGYISFQLGDYDYYKYVKGITTRDIEYIKLISKDGTECIVKKFDFIRSAEQKRHFSFLLDHSGSMGDNRASQLQSSLFNAIKGNAKNDDRTKYSVYKFSELNLRLVNSKNIEDIRSALLPTNGLDGFGRGTAIKDALITAISDLQSEPNEDFKLIVLFTDGVSNSDQQNIPMNEVIRKALENNINIVVVGFGSHLDITYLKNIANNSGGNLYHIYDPAEFQTLFDNIFKDVSISYNLEFNPCMFGNDITIEMKIKGNDKPVIGRTVFRTPLAEGYTIDLNILFDQNSDKINEIYNERLDGIVKLMTFNTKLEIRIEGHTDKLGNENINQQLSEKRAVAVRQYFVKKGININRISVKGYGSTKPAFEYKTGSVENPFNRRIEIVITKK